MNEYIWTIIFFGTLGLIMIGLCFIIIYFYKRRCKQIRKENREHMNKMETLTK